MEMDGEHGNNSNADDLNLLRLRNRTIRRGAQATNFDENAQSEVGSQRPSQTSSRRLQLELEVEEEIANKEREIEEREAERERRQAERDARELARVRRLAALRVAATAASSRASSRADHSPPGSRGEDGQRTVRWVEDSAAPGLGRCDTQVGDNVINSLSPDVRCFLARQTVAKDLPTFDGNLLDWPFFFAQFQNSTKSCSFSEEENILRLRNALKGEARQHVATLLLIPGSMNRVIDKLSKRYGRPDEIIRTVMSKLDSIPNMSEGNFQGLTKLADDLDNVVNTITLVNRPEYLYNPILLSNIVKKLNSTLRLQWGEYSRGFGVSPVQLTQFNTWLQEKSMALGSTELFDRQEKGKKYNPDFANKGLKTCSYCEYKGHSVHDCRKFSRTGVEDKYAWAIRKNICFRCLKPGHKTVTCNSKVKCSKYNGSHHDLLHKNRTESLNTNVATVENTNTNSLPIKDVPHKQVNLKILPVILTGPNGSIPTYAFLDDGSTITMVEHTVAEKLGIKGPVKPFSINWTNDMNRTESGSMIVSFQISGKSEGAKQYRIYDARTVEKLCLPQQSIDKAVLESCWAHLKGVKLDSYTEEKPSILIGQDNWPLIVGLKVKYGPWKGPVPTKTRLGWVLHANIVSNKSSNSNSSLCHFANNDETLHNLVDSYLRNDNFGTECSYRNLQINNDDQLAMEMFQATTLRIGNFWETGLIWKPNRNFPDSRPMAFQRLRSVERRMDRDPTFSKAYIAKMNDLLQKGYASKQEPGDLELINVPVWYLPHLGVVNPNKPNKFRICFDASAKVNGISLNDNLLKGPDLFVDIKGVLWRFRQFKIAIGGDIKEMYSQIRIRHCDQMVQKFLWRGADRSNSPDVYIMRVMVFGIICSPYSAQETKNKNANEFIKSHPRAVEVILRNHYMDDYLDSVETVEEARQLVSDVRYVHSKGGFLMCNWISNSKDVINSIPPELRAESSQKLLNDDRGWEKLLGIWWNPENDTFCYRFKKELLQPLAIPTKRQVLRFVMSVFDPLGLISFVLIGGKILLQEIWKQKLQWDDPISLDLNNKFVKWLDVVHLLENISIPRCYNLSVVDTEGLQLHIFCDASDKAFAAAVYLRHENLGSVNVQLLTSKAKVAPLKTCSIPRLELQAALLGCRIATVVIKEHTVKFSKIFFWTDSRTVIAWIRSNKRVDTFVSNRVTEIRSLSSEADWRWLPSVDNVVDEATRFPKFTSITVNDRWFKGPDFLYLNPQNWPIERAQITNLEDQVESVGATISTEKFKYLPDVSKFSNYTKLVRSTAWVFRFIGKCQKTNPFSGELTPEELEKSETIWFKKAQNDSYAEEIRKLRENSPIGKNSKIFALSPILGDDGLLRIRGRINKAEGLQKDTYSPIILDRRHPLTVMMLRRYHINAMYQGQETVLHELRQKFWAPQARQAIRNIIRACIICQMKNAVPMGQLPAVRLKQNCRPFTHAGVDYFGPFLVTIGRRQEKRYGVIFTCLSIRAVHLEIAHDLTSDSTVMAVRRFIARRGVPTEIFLDNGTNFKNASKEIRSSIKSLANSENSINRELSLKGVKWTFIPPGAPHMGGAWERLIRTVKVALQATLKEKAPREEVLLTLMAEVENLVNCRPLTRVSSNPEDLECLTPNHFLIGTNNNFIPVTESKDSFLRKSWQRSQQLADEFWSRWMKEYLPSLNQRHKWHGDENKEPLKVGDLVLIADKNQYRGHWKRGLIQAVYPGEDGRIRVADVKTPGGLLTRPATKLCRLHFVGWSKC